MLKPIKSFFNYLQKNANSSNIFRLSNDLSMSDAINSSPMEGEGAVYEDPLTDPLAIDDDFDENGLKIEKTSVIDNTASSEVNDFIFVDIEKLKCNEKENQVKYEEPKNLKSRHLKSSEYGDINGNKKHVNREINSKNKVKLVHEENKLNASLKEYYQLDEQNKFENDSMKTEKKIEGTSVMENNNKNVDNISFVISATNSEPDEIEEITDTSEVRSDGSDSGLGLDILRNISVIEKSLANLTPSKSSLKRRSSDLLHDDQPKKQKQGINFGNVTVFYFPRCQGFGCVPTQGGSTLGMVSKHAYKKTFTLSEHAVEQRRLNRLKMTGNDLNQCSSSSDESKSEDEISENSLSEADSEAYGFLQPITARQRRAILKSAGVRKIDITEKDECRQLRTSREVCGCSCRGFCDPDTCECSLAGIKCQVDRQTPNEFPCSCTRDGCANVNGRVEFNPARVKTHFIHTIMRLELEKRQELSEVQTSSTIVQSIPPTKWWMRLQSSQSGANANFNNYMYNNGGSTISQYSGKIPPISMISSSLANSESLDLHYAYRDEYTNSLTLSTESSTSSFNNSSNDYFNYNYMNTVGSTSNSEVHSYHLNTQMAYHQQHNISHNQVHSVHQQNFNSNCQYSNYSPSSGSLNDLNGINSHNYITNYSPSMHNGAVTNRYPVPTQTISTASQGTILNTENYNLVNRNSNCSILPSSTVTSLQTNSEQTEPNENHNEVMKKSVAESVSA